MGYELSYESWITGVGSREIDEEIRSTESTIEYIKQSIFALICMPPNMVQQKSRRKGDKDSENWPNDEYLVHRWRELYEELDENICRLSRLYAAKGAIERKTRTVFLCPKCFTEVKNEYSEEDKGYHWFCPNCGKFEELKDADYDSSEVKKQFITATINTFSEG